MLRNAINGVCDQKIAHQKRGEIMKKIKTADIIQRCIDNMAVIPAPPWWLSIVISVLAIVITVCKR